MSFFEQYRSGNLVLPNALFFHFKDIFPSADDFLVWQFLYLQTTTQIGEVASSQIAQATGKTPTEVNKSITTLTEAGLLDFTTIKVNNEIEMVVDASPALAVLDKLVSNEKTTTGPVVGQPTNTQLIKQLTDELEQALGILNPMVIEDLNKEIQEEHTDPELIREALKEAVFNRKTNWNYIKGVLRNWKLSGITTKIQVEERRLEWETPFQLLVAVILSAQTTDKAVNKITPGLWARYPEIEDLASANLDDVEMCLRTIGLYKNKAKNIIKTARAVLMNFDGQVPKTHKELESLPGVGRKTANVVLAEVYGIPSIAVDTHVSRVSKRLNIVPEDASVEEIEAELMKKIPKRDWIISHHRMIFFGRYHCLAKNPKCQTCPLQSYCKYYKETTKK